jgi:hypothetical protein
VVVKINGISGTRPKVGMRIEGGGKKDREKKPNTALKTSHACWRREAGRAARRPLCRALSPAVLRGLGGLAYRAAYWHSWYYASNRESSSSRGAIDCPCSTHATFARGSKAGQSIESSPALASAARLDNEGRHPWLAPPVAPYASFGAPALAGGGRGIHEEARSISEWEVANQRTDRPSSVEMAQDRSPWAHITPQKRMQKAEAIFRKQAT